ncbi:hypothetical protein [Bradyrhizobium sp. UFLA03-84]|uniref:hypothetical protein n=1 Tax=Bradyrhizobium sp. UFLA03-84 TaxID=418599 RepID=UPI001FD95205|nr:hypothetical protein [Bradyrhizobium sp. UFLA03-84]
MTRDENTCKGRVAACLSAIAILAAAPIPATAQQFAADLIARKDGTATAIGTLRVSGRKARIETTALPDGFFLLDTAGPAAYFVRPAAHVYMNAMQSSPLTQQFVPVDPDDPCRQWLAMAQLSAPIDLATWHCQHDGQQAIAGRDTEIYRIAAPSGLGFTGWIDRARSFPVQIKTEDGTVISADHIRDEPQPAQSFELPAGLRKFDPHALIRRIQQSDVWVEPPASQ